MRISNERLAEIADQTGFRSDMLEKAIQLLGLLEGLQDHPTLKGKLALKGGTALNVFYLDIPRLSVDIDLNYFGASSREDMLAERPELEAAIRAVCSREGFSVARVPDEHAGGKWRLRYEAAAGGGGNLELDINYMYRVPLWPVIEMDSHALGPYRARGTLLVDIHELAAGKLAALLSRRQARDLFDSNQLLKLDLLDPSQLRLAFVVYGAGNRRDWRTVALDDVEFDEREIVSQLTPTLNRRVVKGLDDVAEFGRPLVDECKESLSMVLPFTNDEMAFLDTLLDDGVIEPRLLTTDFEMQQKINNQPMLKWKALNVASHRAED